MQPIEAGAAFRAIAERVGLFGIRRQREAWQREASSDFTRGQPGRAFDRYQQHGAIHFAENRSRTKEELTKRWSEYPRRPRGFERFAHPGPYSG